MRWIFRFLMLGWLCAPSVGVGRDALELESRVVGDGWFEYRLRTLDDPFFQRIDFFSLGVDPFTNYLENTVPLYWTNYYVDPNWFGLSWTESPPQPRIQEFVFAARSSSTHVRRGSNSFKTTFNLHFTDPYFFGGSIGGYLNLACLVPCAPEEADGSPDTLLVRHEFVPDIEINGLIVTNGQVYGVTFSWNRPSTVQLEGSHDMTNWAIIAQFNGSPPQSSWTTNSPLNPYGSFFRLALVATTDSIQGSTPLELAEAAPHLREIPISTLESLQGEIVVGFESSQGATYVVDHCDWSDRVLDHKQMVAGGYFTTVAFEIHDQHSAGWFKVKELRR